MKIYLVSLSTFIVIICFAKATVNCYLNSDAYRVRFQIDSLEEKEHQVLGETDSLLVQSSQRRFELGERALQSDSFQRVNDSILFQDGLLIGDIQNQLDKINAYEDYKTRQITHRCKTNNHLQ